MAVKKILTDRGKNLRKVSAEVTDFDDKLSNLLDDLRDTMRAEDGLGIAAPQIGVLSRVFIMEIDEGFVEMVNPIIISAKGTQLGLEGCLSVKGNCYVERPMKVEVVYQDRSSQYHKGEFTGLWARCCCHECEHLDGGMFYDSEYEGEVTDDMITNQED